MAAKNKPVEIDYVYASTDVQVFRNAHVEAKVGNDMFEIVITPEVEMSHDELESLLEDIESDMIKKMRSRLTECRVILNQNGMSYNVTLSKDKTRVKGLLSLE